MSDVLHFESSMINDRMKDDAYWMWGI